MKRLNLLILLLLVLPVGAIAQAQGIQVATGWDVVGEGIEYQQFRITDPAPVDVFVARMARNNPATTIESSIAQGRLTGGHESVSNMAARYDDALNFWGPADNPPNNAWGSTNDVVVAINGFYYGPPWEDAGVPWSGQIHSGWYAKRFTDNESGSGFIWKMDRSAFIGACITHPNDPPSPKQYVYTEAGDYLVIDGINRTPGENELILFTPQYDRKTPDGDRTEVLVEMQRPTHTSVFGNMPFGAARKFRNSGSTLIPFDHVVLSGTGTKAQALNSKLSLGENVGIAQRVKDCPAEPVENNWDLAYAGVGGHWRFLRGGVIYPYSDDGQANVRDPRTAIAYNDQYVFFMVADGRNPGISEGMTVAEMADFAKNTLGATDAIMQDGGGSSTMVVNGQVVNNSYCNNVICPGINGSFVYLPLVVKSSTSDATEESVPSVDPLLEWDAELQVLQRLVANGMLMVNVQPKDLSAEFDPNDPVSTVGSVDLYLGPGTNYAVLSAVESTGSILETPNDLDGIWAKGTYWWKVDFDGIEGWVLEETITRELKLRRAAGFKNR
jgi:hypothetical protein